MTTAPTYRACPDARSAVPLDELTAIYHRPSGLTHVLAASACAVLEALTAEPVTVEVVLLCLRERFVVDDGEAAALPARLAELVAAGLVERT